MSGSVIQCPVCGRNINLGDTAVHQCMGPRIGWSCPRCKRSNAPDVKTCPCSTGEYEEKTKRVDY